MNKSTYNHHIHNDGAYENHLDGNGSIIYLPVEFVDDDVHDLRYPVHCITRYLLSLFTRLLRFPKESCEI